MYWVLRLGLILSGLGYSGFGFLGTQILYYLLSRCCSLSLTKHALASLPYLTAQTHLFYVYVKTTFADNMHILKVLDLLGLGYVITQFHLKNKTDFTRPLNK